MPAPSVPTTEFYPKLLSLAVHELRTPASVVAGYLRMVMQDTETPLSDRQRKMLQEAEKSCVRMAAIVAELSDVGKIDAGLSPFARQELDLLPLLHELASNMHEAEERDVRFEVRGAETGAPITGDATRIQTAFHSIFRAILREQPSACTVVADCRIETVGGVRSAVVVVAETSTVQAGYDSPAGPFDDKRGGLGLALPIARRVIEGHGGTLSAPSAPAGSEQPTLRSAAVITFPLRS